MDVANALGMPKATLYHYISAKEDLLAQILALAADDVDILMEETAKLEVPPVTRLRLFISGYCYLTTVELERTIIYASGMANIRDVIPFPRAPRQAEF